ncbi:MAG: VWA domain-containing protein [Planctomycetota bacterium]
MDKYSRILIFAIAAMVMAFCAAMLVGAEEPRPRPLDLPAGKAFKDDEDEDDPESIIFYGQEYEADAFFWCVDRSGSMNGPPIIALRAELQSAVSGLSRQAEFGLVTFSNGAEKYKPHPVRARPSEKAAAIAWIQAIAPNGMTCLGDGGVACLEVANQCRKRNKRMICMADGGANCPGCATEVPQITTANWQRIPIDTLFVGSSANGADCLEQLANENGGTFALIGP